MRPIIPVFWEAEVLERATPSAVEVQYQWKICKEKLAYLEGIFSELSQRIRRLRRWYVRGFVSSLKMEDLTEDNDILADWFKRLTERILDAAELEDEIFSEGGGI